MKVRAQIGMVLNLDKCIGCHTYSITCKNVWTSRKGVEYSWFNNVETKPGIGYPDDWEDQDKYKGGWISCNLCSRYLKHLSYLALSSTLTCPVSRHPSIAAKVDGGGLTMVLFVSVVIQSNNP